MGGRTQTRNLCALMKSGHSGQGGVRRLRDEEGPERESLTSTALPEKEGGEGIRAHSSEMALGGEASISERERGGVQGAKLAGGRS